MAAKISHFMAETRGSKHEIFPPKGKMVSEEKWVRKLERDDGSWCYNNEDMTGMAVQYFTNLFTADLSIVPHDIVNLFEL